MLQYSGYYRLTNQNIGAREVLKCSFLCILLRYKVVFLHSFEKIITWLIILKSIFSGFNPGLLKAVTKLVPDFDGKNILLNEYIEKLKQAKEIISAGNEQNLIQILKIKLNGETYKALTNVEITNIEKFIQSIRKLYPSTDNIYSLYEKVIQKIQGSDEDVLSFANS